jgi:hypothetical protein
VNSFLPCAAIFAISLYLLVSFYPCLLSWRRKTFCILSQYFCHPSFLTSGALLYCFSRAFSVSFPLIHPHFGEKKKSSLPFIVMFLKRQPLTSVYFYPLFSPCTVRDTEGEVSDLSHTSHSGRIRH